MNWLALTGVNGFIGHNLAWELLFPDCETYSDRPIQGRPPRIDQVLGIDLPASECRQTHTRLAGTPNYHYISGIAAVSAIDERTAAWGSPPLAVIHNGACSSTTVQDPNVFRTQNVEASQALFGYCADHGIPLLYASSASVYGNGDHGFSDRMEDNDRYSPMNLYGRSKHEFDRWVLQQTRRPPIWFGMRYFNVFGPFEEHKASQASIFHWGRRQILESGRLRLYASHLEGLADGHQKRDFVPVHDICRVTWSLLSLALRGKELSQSGRFVNVGRGHATTWLEIGGALFDALNRPQVFEFVPMPPALQAHYQNYTCADLSTLQELGIDHPFMDLSQAFSAALVRESRATPAP